MLQNSSGLLTFEWYNLILNTTHEQIVKYCKNKKIKILSKDEFNHIKNMIKKWKNESKKVHYKMSKQEKRKLKKIHRKTIESL